jgi:arginyl-tRNA synthetase
LREIEWLIHVFVIIGDQEALSLWKRFRDLSISEYESIYRRLGVKFTTYSGESMVGDGIPMVENLMKEKNLLQEDKGALIINLEVNYHNSLLTFIVKYVSNSI